MKYRKILISFSVLLTAFGNAPVDAAGGSWKFQQQLPAKDAGIQITQPIAITADFAAKRYYVVDAGSGQLVSFDKDGTFLAAFNAGGQLSKPVAMARTSTGSLWVVERSSNELLYVNPRQRDVKRFQPKYADGTKVFLSRLALDSQDRVYVLDRMKGAVLRLDDNLKIVQSFESKNELGGFTDIRIKADNLFALNGLGKKIYQYALSGETTRIVTLEEGLQFPAAFEVDSAGFFYLLDRHAGTVVVFSGSGERRFAFLGKGKRNGQLWNATDLLFDWDGQLCIVDEGNVRVDILTR